MSLEVTYKNQQIAQLTQDGSMTLKTSGTFLEDDIGLSYSGGGGGGSVSGSIHVWTKSTGNYDAALYVQHGTWDGQHSVFTPDGEQVSILYTDVDGVSNGWPSEPYIAYNIASIYYVSNSGWKIVSLVDVTYNNTNYSPMSLLSTWTFRTSNDFYVDVRS